MGLTRIQDKQIRAAFLAHYSIEGWEKPLAVTLTLKRALQTDSGWVMGNDHHYSGALKHALNVVNHRCFGPRWRSKGHGVKAIAVLETGASGRCHYHLAVDCPAQNRSLVHRRDEGRVERRSRFDGRQRSSRRKSGSRQGKSEA